MVTVRCSDHLLDLRRVDQVVVHRLPLRQVAVATAIGNIKAIARLAIPSSTLALALMQVGVLNR